MYIQQISAVNTKVAFKTLSEQADQEALIDSGATENFINYDTWERMNIRWRKTEIPITVYNVDGSKNRLSKIMHFCWLRITY
jgi:hypothetical protein